MIQTIEELISELHEQKKLMVHWTTPITIENVEGALLITKITFEGNPLEAKNPKIREMAYSSTDVHNVLVANEADQKKLISDMIIKIFSL